jgi:hypothetical protein
MKGKKEYLVIALLMVALSVYIILKKTDRRQYDLPEPAPVEQGKISKIRIVRSGGEITLQREGDRWLIEPGGHAAETSQVDAMLEILGGLTLTALASEAGNDPIYELDPDRGIHVTAYQGEEVVRSVWVGKSAPTGQHTFVKLEGDPRIYHARENFRARFDRDADRLRDKQVMKISEAVTEVTLRAGGKSVRIVKADAAGGGEAEPPGGGPEAAAVPKDVWRTDDGEPVKSREVESLLRTLSDLKCTGYLPEAEGGEIGNPVFTVSVRGNGDAYELSLYGTREGKVIGTSSENDSAFFLPEWQARKIQVDMESLKETAPKGP